MKRIISSVQLAHEPPLNFVELLSPAEVIAWNIKRLAGTVRRYADRYGIYRGNFGELCRSCKCMTISVAQSQLLAKWPDASERILVTS